MSFFPSHLRNRAIRDEWVEWRLNNWAGVMPSVVKQAVLAHGVNTIGKICIACSLGNGNIEWKAGSGSTKLDPH